MSALKSLHLLIAVVAGTLVTGCSSADGSSGTSATDGPVSTVAVGLDPSAGASTTPSVGAPTSSVPSATITTAVTTIADPGPGPDITLDDAVQREGLEALLLNTGDITPDFVESDVSLPAGTTPCGFSIDEQYPAEHHRTVLQPPTSGRSVFEELRFYPNTRVASEAYDAIVAGLSCGGNDQFSLGDVTDVSFELDAEAIAVSYSNADVGGVIIVAELAEVLVGLQFQGPPDATNTDAAPDPLALARIAVHRVVAYSEA